MHILQNEKVPGGAGAGLAPGETRLRPQIAGLISSVRSRVKETAEDRPMDREIDIVGESLSAEDLLR